MIQSTVTTNPDGTTTEINTQTVNGVTTITETKYDRNGNIISRSTRPQHQNNFNNANIIIYSGNNSNHNSNPTDVDITTDNYGNTIETRTEHLPNGGINKITITKDRNGNIIGQSMQSMGGNNNNFMVNNNMNMGMNWDNFNRNMNNMNNNLNNMNMNMGMNWDNFNRNMNNMNNNLNNMNMNMGMNWDNFNRNMNNMSNNLNNNMNNMNMNMMMNWDNFNRNMNNMSNNLNNMFNNMGNFMGNYMGNFVNPVMYGNMQDIGNPVDPVILNNLPENKVHDPSKLDPEKKNCVICLEDFKEGDDIIILPCIHVFHKTCITDWLQSHNDCPICKFELTRSSVGL